MLDSDRWAIPFLLGGVALITGISCLAAHIWLDDWTMGLIAIPVLFIIGIIALVDAL